MLLAKPKRIPSALGLLCAVAILLAAVAELVLAQPVATAPAGAATVAATSPSTQPATRTRPATRRAGREGPSGMIGRPPAAATQSSDPKLLGRSFNLNTFVRRLDGQWEGMRYASDGNVYFASSTHTNDHGAAFFRYDPRKDELTMLCDDVTRVCGEDPAKDVPQGKLHSDCVEVNGKLYMATHLANYWPEAAARYTGSHLLSYDLVGGKLQDLGVLKPRFSCYSGMAVDPKGQYAYNLVMSWVKQEQTEMGTRIIRTDLATGKKTDLGRVPGDSQGAGFYMFADNRGNCWFTILRGTGAVYVARSDKDSLEMVEGALKNLPLIAKAGASATAPSSGSASAWTWGQPMGDGQRFIFTAEGAGPVGGTLYIFDAAKMPDSQAAFTAVADIGPTGLGLALAGGRVYYVQRADGRAAGNSATHHLRSVGIAGKDRGVIIDHGRIVDQDGRIPWRSDAVAADGKGKVFLNGDFYLLEGDKGSYRLSYRWKPGTPSQYDELDRGQFFLVADVSKDLK